MSVNVASVLKGAKKKTKSPKTEMLELTDKSGLVEKFKARHAVLKTAKAALALVEDELLDDILPKYTNHLRTNRYVNSVRVSSGKEELTVSWKDAYTKIPTEHEDDIRKAVGNQYGDFFQESNTITVKPEVVENPDVLKELIEKVGEETFSKYFTVDQSLKPTKRFTEERHKSLTPKVNQKLGTWVTQYKPSIRVKSAKGK